MNQYKKLSIIIPVYNEVATVKELLDQVKCAPVPGLEKEILVVDDNSTDGTSGLLRSLNDPELKILYHDVNTGKGGAIHTGFAAATGDIVVIQDADLEYDPQEIQKVVQPFLESNADVVYGSRYLEPSPGLGFWHSWFNRQFTGVGNIFTGLSLTDLMTCYKAFNRKALESFAGQLESKRFGFEPEVTARLARAGFAIREVPISYKPRTKGEGKHMNLKNELECLWVLIKYSVIKK